MDEMKKCGSCDSKNPGEALFCMRCGASLGAPGGRADTEPSPPHMPPGSEPPPHEPPAAEHPMLGIHTAGHPPTPGIHSEAPPPMPAANAGPETPAAASTAVHPPPQVLPTAYPPVSMPLQTDGMAIASLILGVIGLATCFNITGVLAVIFGYVAKKKIRESNGTLGGDGLATAGLIIGWIDIAIMVLFIIFIIIVAITDTGNAMSALL
jgi:Domain of unknown function (DUF4190)